MNTTTLLGVPVTTIVHLIVAITGAILLITQGNLTHDYLVYSGIVEGGNGALAIGRGLDQHAKP